MKTRWLTFYSGCSVRERNLLYGLGVCGAVILTVLLHGQAKAFHNAMQPREAQHLSVLNTLRRQQAVQRVKPASVAVMAKALKATGHAILQEDAQALTLVFSDMQGATAALAELEYDQQIIPEQLYISRDRRGVILIVKGANNG